MGTDKEPDRRRINQKLVDSFLRKPHRGDDRPITWDTLLKGFGIRRGRRGDNYILQAVYPYVRDGERWILNEKRSSSPRPIASLAEMTAEKARDTAGEWIGLIDKNIDPGMRKEEEKEAHRNAVAQRKRDSFATVADDHLRLYAKRRQTPRTYLETRRHLMAASALWGKRPIADIGRREIAATLDELALKYPTDANRRHAALSKLFNWCIERGVIAVSPMAKMSKPAEEESRDRVLGRELGVNGSQVGNDELLWFWKACGSVSEPFRTYFRLLLVLGQRRSELAQVVWSEIDLERRLWTLPAERSKNGEKHEVPLPELALSLLRALPRVSDTYVFTTTTKTPISSFSVMKARIELAMEAERRKALHLADDAPPGIKHWQAHDLRRTMATVMVERLAVAPHVIDHILNHVSGASISDIGRVYVRANSLEPKRHALELWGRYLGELFSEQPASDKVRKLPRKRRTA